MLRSYAWPPAGSAVGVAMARPFDNVGAIRLALALAVVVSHAFSVGSGSVANEPLVKATGFTLGEHAVNGFFALSGLLVTLSFARSGVANYVIARLLRIAPGLVAATLLVALVLGPVLTTLPLADYFGQGGVGRFITATLTSFKSSGSLPGVFADNPFPFPLATVWTLKYETICYAAVLLLGIAGAIRYRVVALGLVAGFFTATVSLDVLHPDAPQGMQTALRLPLIFATGAALYLYRDITPLSAPILAALALVTWLAAGTGAYKALLFVTTAYAVIWLSFAPGFSHPILTPKWDLSYGIYLYGWPVQQTVYSLYPSVPVAVQLAVSIALSVSLAALSWLFIEKPALTLKARLRARQVKSAVAS